MIGDSVFHFLFHVLMSYAHPFVLNAHLCFGFHITSLQLDLLMDRVGLVEGVQPRPKIKRASVMYGPGVL